MILVTGATGFLGPYLVRKLLERGEKVRILVRHPNHLGSIDDLKEKLSVAKGDVLDLDSLEDAFDNVEKVYHLAAVVSFWRGKYREMKSVNVNGTENMVNLALEKKVKRFLHVSSSSAFGRSLFEEFITEETKWKKSPYNTFYAGTKRQAELCVFRAITEGLDAVIANPAVIIGAGNWSKGTPRLFRRVYKGLPFYNDGANSFVDVRDAAEALILLMERGQTGEQYLLSAEYLLYKDFFDRIAERLNAKKPYLKVGGWIGNIGGTTLEILGMLRNKEPLITRETVGLAQRQYRYSSKKFQDEFGFSFRSFEETLNYTCECFKREYVNGNKN